MSIAARLQFFELFRANNQLDNYGVMSSTPEKIAELTVAISKNTPTHEYTNPTFETTEYLGITNFVGVQNGDELHALDGADYIVVGCGDHGTQYQALFLTKK